MLRTRLDEHFSRKIFHILSGSICAFIFVSTLTRNQAIVAMLVSAFLLGTFDLLRLKIPRLNKLVLRVYGPLMRENEVSRPSGQFFYLLGIGFAVIFLPRPVAVQCILTLAWMDPLAALVGKKYGRTYWVDFLGKFFFHAKEFPKSVASKTVEGSFAGLLGSLVAGVAAWTGPWASFRFNEGALNWPGTWQILLLSLVGGVTATIAEAWPSQWDDNVNIPFWTGLMVWACVKIIGLPIYFG